MQGLHGVSELPIAPARYSQDELQGLPVGQLHLLQLIHIVKREQAAIGHDDQALDVRVAAEHLLERGQQCRRLSLVAIEDLVINRQALGCLHHAQHELARDDAFLAHAELYQLQQKSYLWGLLKFKVMPSFDHDNFPFDVFRKCLELFVKGQDAEIERLFQVEYPSYSYTGIFDR